MIMRNKDKMVQMTWKETVHMCFADCYDFYLAESTMCQVKPADDFQHVMANYMSGGIFLMEESKYNTIFPKMQETETVTMPKEIYQGMVEICEAYQKLKSNLEVLVENNQVQGMVLPAVIS